MKIYRATAKIGQFSISSKILANSEREAERILIIDFEYAKQISNNYHTGGAILIIGDDLEKESYVETTREEKMKIYNVTAKIGKFSISSKILADSEREAEHAFTINLGDTLRGMSGMSNLKTTEILDLNTEVF